jgi:hypothetical protein
MAMQLGPDAARQQLVESLGVPPAVHVRFAESQRAIGYHPTVKFIIMNMNVPTAITAKFYIGEGEDFYNRMLEFTHRSSHK